MPSRFESLSMVALEAWGLGRPVLANGRCDVLRGQTIRSRAGLYYDDFPEFAETLFTLTSNRPLHQAFGENGRRFYERHYAWPVIQRKYEDMLGQLSRAERRAGRDRRAARLAGTPAADAGAGAGDRRRHRQGPGGVRRAGGTRGGAAARPGRRRRGTAPRPSPVAGRQAVRSGPHGRGRRPQGNVGRRIARRAAAPASRARSRQVAAARPAPAAPGAPAQERRRAEGLAGSPGRPPGTEPAGASTAAAAEERVTRSGGRRLDGRGDPRSRAAATSRPPGAGDARLRRRHRPRGARHPEGAARRRLPLGHLRRDRRLAARGPDPRLSRPDRRERRPRPSSSTTSRSDRAPRASPTRCRGG